MGAAQRRSELAGARGVRRNISVGGGVAPVRAYIAELLPDVLDGAIDPGRVFDLELPWAGAEAYAAMDERRSVKALLRP